MNSPGAGGDRRLCGIQGTGAAGENTLLTETHNHFDNTTIKKKGGCGIKMRINGDKKNLALLAVPASNLWFMVGKSLRYDIQKYSIQLFTIMEALICQIVFAALHQAFACFRRAGGYGTVHPEAAGCSLQDHSVNRCVNQINDIVNADGTV
jgi:hypothetical protein